MTKPPRIGRPIKPATDGERVMLGLRVTADLKRRLEKESLRTGRSLSAEAELRLLKSFEADDLKWTIRESVETVFEQFSKRWAEGDDLQMQLFRKEGIKYPYRRERENI